MKSKFQKGNLIEIIGSGVQGIRQVDLGSKMGVIDTKRTWCYRDGQVVDADAYTVVLTNGYRTLVAAEDIRLIPKVKT